MKNNSSKKNIIITGANSGIGFELAKKLINENYRVILACRDNKKGFEAEKKLGINSKFMKLDLSSYSSIDSFSKKLRQDKVPIHCLINNAGIMFHPNNILDSGINITFFVNYISYFYLTLKIIDLLENNNDSKVINVSSISSYSIKKFDWKFFNPQSSDNSLNYRRELYAYTNIFRLMFSMELSKILKIESNYNTKPNAQMMVANCKTGQEKGLIEVSQAFESLTRETSYIVEYTKNLIIVNSIKIAYLKEGKWKLIHD